MAKKLRNTRQKEIIQKAIDKTEEFFSAEKIYSLAVKGDKKIGIATVYRYLNYLKEKNLIHSYTCNRRTIFSKNKESHCHFVCTKCNKTEHIKIKSLDFLKGTAINQNNVCHFQIEVEGICKNCIKNK
jgi:Fe2+ or Zn2+ uptake regulation protein